LISREPWLGAPAGPPIRLVGSPSLARSPLSALLPLCTTRSTRSAARSHQSRPRPHDLDRDPTQPSRPRFDVVRRARLGTPRLVARRSRRVVAAFRQQVEPPRRGVLRCVLLSHSLPPHASWTRSARPCADPWSTSRFFLARRRPERYCRRCVLILDPFLSESERETLEVTPRATSRGFSTALTVLSLLQASTARSLKPSRLGARPPSSVLGGPARACSTRRTSPTRPPRSPSPTRPRRPRPTLSSTRAARRIRSRASRAARAARRPARRRGRRGRRSRTTFSTRSTRSSSA